MTKIVRKVIKINEELCNGCGECVPSCAEGAIQIIDGKARLVSDKFCDGLGACLGECPMGALSFEEREADEYDETAVHTRLKEIGRSSEQREEMHLKRDSACGHGGCPGSRVVDFRSDAARTHAADAPKLPSELRQWPVKLNLANPSAPYFLGADLVLAADCTAFACASFHPELLKGKALAIGCPKFDGVQDYIQKLKSIIETARVTSITVVHMEVPCCTGLLFAAKEAIRELGSDVLLESVVISIRGDIKA
jgi:NAD-dependent dihydropyrimidine dehydrogenase PreA subunit